MEREGKHTDAARLPTEQAMLCSTRYMANPYGTIPITSSNISLWTSSWKMVNVKGSSPTTRKMARYIVSAHITPYWLLGDMDVHTLAARQLIHVQEMVWQWLLVLVFRIRI